MRPPFFSHKKVSKTWAFSQVSWVITNPQDHSKMVTGSIFCRFSQRKWGPVGIFPRGHCSYKPCPDHSLVEKYSPETVCMPGYHHSAPCSSAGFVSASGNLHLTRAKPFPRRRGSGTHPHGWPSRSGCPGGRRARHCPPGVSRPPLRTRRPRGAVGCGGGPAGPGGGGQAAVPGVSRGPGQALHGTPI